MSVSDWFDRTAQRTLQFPLPEKTCEIALHCEKCYWSNRNYFFVVHFSKRHFENLLYLSTFARLSFSVSLQLHERALEHTHVTG